MPQVKYIATTPKTDSINGVGLPWEPGQTRNVSDEMAEKLLAFPDTWEMAEEDGKSPQEAPLELGQVEKPDEEPLVIPNLHGMTVQQMRDFAQETFNVKFDRDMKAADMRIRLHELQSERNLHGGG
jgi:hypothetical protein